MSATAIALGLLAGAAGVVLGDLASSEVRGRLDRIPLRLIRLAARRLAEPARTDSTAEWTAELHAVLHERGADAVPLARLIIGMRFALGIVRAARTIDRDLRSAIGAPRPAADVATLTETAQAVSRLRAVAHPLVTDLLDAEVGRMSAFVEQLQAGCATYAGEDQDWLLALARSTKVSLDATSLSVSDWGGPYASFWSSNIGRQYLTAQRQLITEKCVAIRRLFILDRAELAADTDFERVWRQQRELGIEVRLLVPAALPPHRTADLADFIIFDEALVYETVNAARQLRTRLYLDAERVAERAAAFRELWEAGVPPSR